MLDSTSHCGSNNSSGISKHPGRDTKTIKTARTYLQIIWIPFFMLFPHLLKLELISNYGLISEGIESGSRL
jgi:hypothetical protein